ncbi:YciI-like protein [Gloeomargarita lithophora Alchichica-D10]|uniref:YciI-like protein n=1 Tax=Gloeomargarita lithophora Alchichica-D10 TaxID=1188229 RepID=A0A1J0ACN2_9CYAN|nr:YciI family protein [Gloeomargarita lithophora]APB33693.1 YciI-like protein [Gloeomargarita lithophora Alchichica-D10]
MAKFVVTGHYCQDVETKRAPYRQAHLAGLAQQKAQGILVTIGPTQDLTRFFAIYEAESAQPVQALIEQDPYWQNGIWTDYEVIPWIQAI